MAIAGAHLEFQRGTCNVSGKDRLKIDDLDSTCTREFQEPTSIGIGRHRLPTCHIAIDRGAMSVEHKDEPSRDVGGNSLDEQVERGLYVLTRTVRRPVDRRAVGQSAFAGRRHGGRDRIQESSGIESPLTTQVSAHPYFAR